jgi:hypothetical protein
LDWPRHLAGKVGRDQYRFTKFLGLATSQYEELAVKIAEFLQWDAVEEHSSRRIVTGGIGGD